MTTRTLGKAGREVSPLGCMGISQSFGPSPERPEMVAFLREAVDRFPEAMLRMIDRS